MKKPARDKHSMDVPRSIAKTYQPGKAARTVLKKKMRQKKRP